MCVMFLVEFGSIWDYSNLEDIKSLIKKKSGPGAAVCAWSRGALPGEGGFKRCGAMSNAMPGVDGVEAEEYDQERESDPCIPWLLLDSTVMLMKNIQLTNSD